MKVYRSNIQNSEKYPREVDENALRVIGSAFKGAKPLIPLSSEECNKYMPQVISMEPSDPGFRDAVKNFFLNLRIKVSLDRPIVLNEQLDEYGNPYDVEDYIKARFIREHPSVAFSKKEMETDMRKMFYVTSEEEERKESIDKTATKEKAYREYLKIVDNEATMNYVIALIASPEEFSNSFNMSIEMKKTFLDNYLTENPKYFYTAVNDNNLKVKAEINAMVKTGVLHQFGNEFYYHSELIGKNLDEVIAYMKSPQTSEKVISMKSELRARTNNAYGDISQFEAKSDEKEKQEKELETTEDNIPKPSKSTKKSTKNK